ncbi:hypothetical protein D3C81_945200 [compost metagenome]
MFERLRKRLDQGRQLPVIKRHACFTNGLLLRGMRDVGMESIQHVLKDHTLQLARQLRVRLYTSGMLYQRPWRSVRVRLQGASDYSQGVEHLVGQRSVENIRVEPQVDRSLADVHSQLSCTEQAFALLGIRACLYLPGPWRACVDTAQVLFAFGTQRCQRCRRIHIGAGGACRASDDHAAYVFDPVGVPACRY